jgi:hypothetical protein
MINLDLPGIMTKTILSISIVFVVKTLAAFWVNFDSKKRNKI